MPQNLRNSWCHAESKTVRKLNDTKLSDIAADKIGGIECNFIILSIQGFFASSSTHLFYFIPIHLQDSIKLLHALILYHIILLNKIIKYNLL